MAQIAGVSSPPKTILVTRLDGLGDTVLTTPLLEGLHRQWPKANIKLLVRPQMISVREILPEWVEVIPLGFDLYQPTLGMEEKVAEQIRLACERVRSDLVILGEYNRVWVSEVLAAMIAPPRVVAFDSLSGLSVMNRKVRDLLNLPPVQKDWQLVQAAYEWREPKKYQAM